MSEYLYETIFSSQVMRNQLLQKLPLFSLGSCTPGTEGIASRAGWKQTRKSLLLQAFSYTNCQNLDQSPGQGLSGVYKPTISAVRVSISPLLYT